MNRQNYWTSDRTAKVGRLIQSLYDVVRQLENEFVDEKRKFTLDGHLVGSVGEVVAAYSFGLTLLPASEKTHDAKKDGKMIQIKLTGGNKSVALSSKPDHLIVLQLQKLKFELVYNGPGAAPWANCSGDPANRGQRPIRLTTLRRLQAQVSDSERIAIERDLPDFSIQDPV